MATTSAKRANVKPAGVTSGSRQADTRGSSRVRGLVVALNTPSDLSGEQVHAVTQAVNPLIADALALYVKCKNFHWHLAGSHFRDYHLLLDEQADSALSAVDILAERIRKIGGTTIRSIGHVSNLTSIQDDNEEFVPAREMLLRLLEDNKRMAKAIRAASELADENKDLATANILQEVLDETERRIWFLHETVQGDNQA
jgi:starvation-inducible DNA-binding protein